MTIRTVYSIEEFDGFTDKKIVRCINVLWHLRCRIFYYFDNTLNSRISTDDLSWSIFTDPVLNNRPVATTAFLYRKNSPEMTADCLTTRSMIPDDMTPGVLICWSNVLSNKAL